MNEYSEQRFLNEQLLAERTEHIYKVVPRIKELDSLIASSSVNCLRQLLTGNKDSEGLKASHKAYLESLSQEKEQLLISNGFSPEDLELQYKCPTCKDTGYINGEKCHCLTNRIIKSLYQQSNIEDILRRENFDTFRLDKYSKEYIDPDLGITPRENILRVLDKVKHFVHNFDTDYDNLLIFGQPGVGKTFLSNCIADRLISAGYSVIYLSSIKFFDLMAKSVFSKNSDEGEGFDFSSLINDCDLLIIDDLGTELVNNFTIQMLFNCINERHLLRKKTIISCNLDLEQLQATYAERIFSRLSTYTILKIVGNDLRIK